MWLKLKTEEFPQLFIALTQLGYDIIGPTLNDAAIVYEKITRVEDLPVGKGEVHTAGGYRLVERNDNAYFGYQVGPQNWRRYLQPTEEVLWQARKTEHATAGQGFEVIATDRSTQKPLAFLGVRSCDLHAIGELDKVFKHTAQDANYISRRDNLLLIAVNCTEAGSKCFCHLTNTGPSAQQGYYDLLLNEMLGDDQHEFLIRSDSAQGDKVLTELASRCELLDVTGDDLQAVASGRDNAIAQMRPRLEEFPVDIQTIKQALYQNPEHSRWDDVAQRCLSCTNCTLACPSCFCSDMADVSNLQNTEAARVRYWDSCFNLEHSHLAGGSVRQTVKSRYRQWATHKFAAWQDQFNKVGCVGCGRCIIWCPVGIDVLAEISAIQHSPTGA